LPSSVSTQCKRAVAPDGQGCGRRIFLFRQFPFAAIGAGIGALFGVPAGITASIGVRVAIYLVIRRFRGY
jgi:hypothetical protein